MPNTVTVTRAAFDELDADRRGQGLCFKTFDELAALFATQAANTMTMHQLEFGFALISVAAVNLAAWVAMGFFIVMSGADGAAETTARCFGIYAAAAWGYCAQANGPAADLMYGVVPFAIAVASFALALSVVADERDAPSSAAARARRPRATALTLLVAVAPSVGVAALLNATVTSAVVALAVRFDALAFWLYVDVLRLALHGLLVVHATGVVAPPPAPPPAPAPAPASPRGRLRPLSDAAARRPGCDAACQGQRTRRFGFCGTCE